MAESGWTLRSPSYPEAASSHPDRAVPSPPPTFTPSDVQENMSPSMRLPVRSQVCSEASAMRALSVPCSELIPRAATPERISMSGRLFM